MNDRERAERAERMLNDAVFVGARADAEASLVDEWKMCQDADERQALWHRIQALDGVARQLRIYVERAALQERQGK